MTPAEYEAVTMIALEGAAAMDQAAEQSRTCRAVGSQEGADFWAAVAIEIAHRTRRGPRSGGPSRQRGSRLARLESRLWRRTPDSKIAGARLPNTATGWAAAVIMAVGLGAGLMLSLPPLLPPDQLRGLRTRPVVLAVRDLERAKRWYQEKLGFVQIAGTGINTSGDEGATVRLLYGQNLLELSDHPRLHADPEAASRVTELVVEDVDAVTTELKERGVEVLEEPRFAKRNLRVSRIRDNEGHPIELQQLL
jgi:catechol 2,3-dioxygenase-like lactoylglutathione lyase family enzyme